MHADNPLVIIEDDPDDQHLFKSIIAEIAPSLAITFFPKAEDLLEALSQQKLMPFMIFSEVHLRGMSGLELRKKMDEDPAIRKKSIPFIFFTHPVNDHDLDKAYDLTIQGFFEKSPHIDLLKQQLYFIIGYWSECRHPKQITRRQIKGSHKD